MQNIREQHQCFDQNDFFWIKKNQKLKKNNIKTKKEGFRERLIMKLNTMTKTEINNIQINDDFILGEDYIEDDLNDDGEYNAKTDGHVKLNKYYNYDNNKISTDEKENKEEEEKEKKEEMEDNLNESNSSNSSLDTKIYQLNGPLRNFLKKNNSIEDENKENNDIKKSNSNDNDIIDKSNSNKSSDNNNINNNINKKLNNTIEENIEEENDIEEKEINNNNIKNEENKINSINNNDNIVTNYSSPNTKEGSVSLSNIKESKESKGKEKSESPKLIIVKKNSDEINYNKLIKEKRVSVDVKKKENRFGQIMGPQIDINVIDNKQTKNIKNNDKDCILF